ncbi:hypothetical protein BGX28_003055 [Mortierella sp. GBA30]|nr:hypothetical protein BGX28_003055 [Mortierella sp. GBA30]
MTVVQREASFGSDSGEQEDELSRYLQLKIVQDVEPLEWWSMNKEKLPTVARLARKYLSLSASSVASERMFSYAKKCLAKLEEDYDYDRYVQLYHVARYKMASMKGW